VLAQTASDAAPARPSGHLTTRPARTGRHPAGAARARPGNREALDVVETALFCVCLEDVVPRTCTRPATCCCTGTARTGGSTRPCPSSCSPTGGPGSTPSTRARRHDRPRLVDAVLAGRRRTAPPSAVRAQDALRHVRSLRPRRGAADRRRGRGVRLRRAAADTATAVLSFPDVGTERIKALRTSPDAFVQLAYQLAHRRDEGARGRHLRVHRDPPVPARAHGGDAGRHAPRC
jgi:carnitine O-acetyltransferase